MDTPETHPAAAEAREELSRIQTDPTHPLHAAWKGNDGEAVTRHMHPYYRKIPGAETPATPPQHFEARGETDEARPDAGPPLPAWAQEAKREMGEAQWTEAVERLGAVSEDLFGTDHGAERAFVTKLIRAGYTPQQIFNAVQQLKRQGG